MPTYDQRADSFRSCMIMCIRYDLNRVIYFANPRLVKWFLKHSVAYTGGHCSWVTTISAFDERQFTVYIWVRCRFFYITGINRELYCGRPTDYKNINFIQLTTLKIPSPVELGKFEYQGDSIRNRVGY